MCAHFKQLTIFYAYIFLLAFKTNAENNHLNYRVSIKMKLISLITQENAFDVIVKIK